MTAALSIGTVAVTAQQAHAATIATGGSVLLGDVNGDGWEDIIGIRGTDASLWFYRNNQHTDPAQRVNPGSQIGYGWSSYNRVMLGDYSGDGYDDIVATTPDGRLWYWANRWNSNPTQPYGSAQQINAGWAMFSRLAMGDVSGDGWDDIIGIKPDGTLWFYQNNRNADQTQRLSPGRQIGTGWGSYDRVMLGDYSGDGWDDILARHDGGTMSYWGNRWNSNQTAPYGAGITLSAGWRMFIRLTMGDFNGDGLDDVIGVKPDGTMWYYFNNAAIDPVYRLSAGIHINSGWGPFVNPPRSDSVKPLYLIHGLDRDRPAGLNCEHRFAVTLADYQSDGNPAEWPRPQIKTVGYYAGDNDCDVMLPVDGTNQYGSVSQEGTVDESIKELGRELSWEIYNRYSRWGISVDVAGHSMGGLITRAMLTGVQNSLSGWAPFVYVEDVSTWSTPHAGSDLALACLFKAASTQCNELKPGSATLVWMDDNPQSAVGTDWTLIGALTDDFVHPSSALGMCCVGHMVVYMLDADDGDNDLITHSNIVSLTSGNFRITYCDYFNPSCVMHYPSGYTDWPELFGSYDPVKIARLGNYYHSSW